MESLEYYKKQQRKYQKKKQQREAKFVREGDDEYRDFLNLEALTNHQPYDDVTLDSSRHGKASDKAGAKQKSNPKRAARYKSPREADLVYMDEIQVGYH